MLKLAYLQTADVSGPDAVAIVVLIDKDDLDREAGSLVMNVQLRPAERKVFQDVIARAELRGNRRITAARAARVLNPAAPVDLQTPIVGEAAP